jgi:hypothetical protein
MSLDSADLIYRIAPTEAWRLPWNYFCKRRNQMLATVAADLLEVPNREK